MADRRKIIAAFVAVTALVLNGCTTLPPIDSGWSGETVRTDTFVPANHDAVDELLKSLHPGRDFPKGQPVIVATVVNIDTLKGSRLGRVLSEQVATRLTQQGYPVAELKLRGTIFVKQSEGELLLSRELQDITLNHKAQAVVVGTYAEARGRVYVSLKIVDAASGQAIAAHDYALPVDSGVYSMLATDRDNAR